MNIINYIIENSTEFVSHGGLLVGFFLVFIECFIPALPLSVFIALNVNAFGMFLGVFISWVATFLGSFLCYLLFYYLGGKFHQKVLNKKFTFYNFHYIKSVKSFLCTLFFFAFLQGCKA